MRLLHRFPHVSRSWARTFWLAQALAVPLLLVFVILVTHHQALAQPPAPVPTQTDMAPVQVLRIAMPGVTPTVDPALVADQQGYLLSSMLYSGLVRLAYRPQAPLGHQYGVVPDLATHWTLAPDHRTYTFYLRHGVRFSNTKHDWLTAADVVYSIERSLSPQLQSPAAGTYLRDIDGADAYMSGRSSTIRGLRALNRWTVRITARWPVPYFLTELAYPTAYIVDRRQIERYGAQGWYAHPAGTGPFRLKSWTPGAGMVLVRSTAYPGARAHLTEVDLGFAPTASAVDTFQNDATDVIAVPLQEWSTAYAVTGFHVTSALALDGVYENWLAKPFDKAHVRAAFTLATDRRALVRSVFGWRAVPFHGYVPYGQAGYDPYLAAWPYDPARARALWDEYVARRQSEGEPVPTITLAYVDDPVQARLAAALRRMWRRALHVRVALEALPLNALLTSAQSGALQMYLAGWQADYPDAHDWLSVQWKTGAPANIVHFSDPVFDALISTADETWRTRRHTQLIAQAQRQLVADNAWLPLYIPEQAAIIRDSIHNVYLTGYGLLPAQGSWSTVYLTDSASTGAPRAISYNRWMHVPG